MAQLHRFVQRTNSSDDFLALHIACLSALETYVVEADRLCQMLWDCNGDAPNARAQLALVAQRRCEHEAHNEYHRARKRLLHAARLDATEKAS